MSAILYLHSFIAWMLFAQVSNTYFIIMLFLCQDVQTQKPFYKLSTINFYHNNLVWKMSHLISKYFYFCEIAGKWWISYIQNYIKYTLFNSWLQQAYIYKNYYRHLKGNIADFVICRHTFLTILLYINFFYISRNKTIIKQFKRIYL